MHVNRERWDTKRIVHVNAMTDAINIIPKIEEIVTLMFSDQSNTNSNFPSIYTYIYMTSVKNSCIRGLTVICLLRLIFREKASGKRPLAGNIFRDFFRENQSSPLPGHLLGKSFRETTPRRKHLPGCLPGKSNT